MSDIDRNKTRLTTKSLYVDNIYTRAPNANTIDVYGGLQINNPFSEVSLSVGNIAHFDNFRATDATLEQSLSVGGDMHVDGILSIGYLVGDGSRITGIPGITPQWISEPYGLSYDNNITIGKTTISPQTGLDISGNARISNNLSIGKSLTISGPLIVNSTSQASTLTGDLLVTGNLQVSGTQTTINTTQVNIRDNIVVLADNNPTNNVPMGILGSYSVAGSSNYTGFLYNPIDKHWWGVTDINYTSPNYFNGVVDSSRSTFYIGEINTLNMFNKGFLSISDQIYLDGSLNISGNALLKQNISINNSVYIENNISIFGNSTLNKLNISGASVLDNTLSISNRSFINGGLYLDNKQYIKTLFVNDVIPHSNTDPTLLYDISASSSDSYYQPQYAFSELGRYWQSGFNYNSDNGAYSVTTSFTNNIKGDIQNIYGDWIEITIPYKYKISNLILVLPYIYNIVNESCPYDFFLLGKNLDNKWDILLQVNNYNWDPSNPVFDQRITNNKSYNTYRIIVTTVGLPGVPTFGPKKAIIDSIEFGGSKEEYTLDYYSDHTLDVSGLSRFKGDLSIYGNIDISGDIYVRDILSVSNQVYLKNILDVSENVYFRNNLSIGANSYIDGDVFIGGNLNLSGNTLTTTTIGDLVVNNTTSIANDTAIGGKLDVCGNTTIYNVFNVSGYTTIANGLSISGRVDMRNNLDVSGNLTVDGTTILTNSLNVSGYTTIDDGLSVSGKVDFRDSLDVSGSLTVDHETILNSLVNISGYTTIANGLSVSGKVDIRDSLDVSGNLTVDGTTIMTNTLNVSGYTTIDDGLSVYGRVDIRNNLDVSGNLTVDGTTIMTNTLNVSGYTTIANGLSVSGSLTVDGSTILTNTLNVSGYTTIDDGVSVSGSLKVDGSTILTNTLNVSGYTTIDDGLSVSGKVDIRGSMDLSGNLTVDSHTILNDILNVSGYTTIASGLSVFGKVDIRNNIDVSGNLTVDGTTIMTNTLNISGYTTIASGLSISGKVDMRGSMDLSGNLTVDGLTRLTSSLNVSGFTTIADGLSVSGKVDIRNNLDISGNLTVDGPTRLTSSLNVSGYTTIDDGLSVSGKVDMRGSMDLSGVLTVDSHTILNDTLNVSGYTTIDDGLSVSGKVDMRGSLDISGSLTVESDALIKSNTTIYGTTFIHNGLDITNDTILRGNTTISGQTDILNKLRVYGATDLYDTLRISGSTTIENTLSVSQTIRGNTVEANSIVLPGNTQSTSISIDSDITMNNTKIVFGGNNSEIHNITNIHGKHDNDLTVRVPGNNNNHIYLLTNSTNDSNKGVIVDTNGDLLLYNALSVNGLTYMSNTVSIGKELYIKDGLGINIQRHQEYVLDVSGNSKFEGNVHISGNLSFDGSSIELNTTSLTVNDNVIAIADGNTDDTIPLGFIAHTKKNGSDPATTTHTGLVKHQNDQYGSRWWLINQYDDNPGMSSFNPSDSNRDSLVLDHLFGLYVDISGDAVIRGNEYISGSIEIASNLSVTGNTGVYGSLSINGITTLANTVKISGATNIIGALDVSGSMRLQNSLSVSGPTLIMNTMTISGATAIYNKLDGYGATSFKDTVGISGSTTLASTLSVSGNTGIGGSLSVTGITTLANAVNISGATTINNSLSVTGITTLANAVNISGATKIQNSLSVSGDITTNSIYIEKATHSFTGGTKNDGNKWFKIAQGSGITYGVFLLTYTVGGDHGALKFSVGTMYNDKPFINILSNSYYLTQAITQIRLSLDSNQYNPAFIEIYTESEFAISPLNIDIYLLEEIPSSSVTLIGSKTAGTSTGYTYYTLPTDTLVQGINTGGATVVTTNTGVVGIGRTDPNSSYKLDVAGVLRVADNASSTSYLINLGSSGVGTTRSAMIYGDGTNMTISNQENGAMIFGTNNTDRMRIAGTGLVGIGTTNPSSKLHVYTAGTAEMYITNDSTGDTFSSIRLKNSGTSQGIILLNSTTRSNDGGANTMTIRNDAGMLRLQDSTGGSNANGITLTGSNVGIGITNPQSTLHIVGSNTRAYGPEPITKGIHMGEGGVNDFAIEIVAGTTTSNSYIDFTTPGVDYNGRIICAHGSSMSILSKNQLIFNTGALLTERMRINTDGNVGINNPLPTVKLDVSGGGTLIKLTGSNSVTEASIAFYPSAANYSKFFKLGNGITNGIGEGNFALYNGGTNQMSWWVDGTTNNIQMRSSHNTDSIFAMDCSSSALRANYIDYKYQNSSRYRVGVNVTNLGANQNFNSFDIYDTVNSRFVFSSSPTTGGTGFGISSDSALGWYHMNITINSPSTGFPILYLGAPNMGNSSVLTTTLGKNTSNYNSFNLKYTHIGNSSTSNYFSINSAGQSDAFTINGSGNVGIGTTNPQNVFHTYRTGANNYFRIHGDVDKQQAIEFFDTAQRWVIYKDSSTTDLKFWDSTADRVTFKSGGNVGIGSTNPQYKLDIVGTGRVNTLYVSNGYWSTNGDDVFINSKLNTDSSIYLRPRGGTSTGETIFQPTSTTIQSNSLVINSSSNVGIRSSNPTAALQIGDYIHIDHTASGNNPYIGLNTYNIYSASNQTFYPKWTGSSTASCTIIDCGGGGGQGNIAFRHKIHGTSSAGFNIVNDTNLSLFLKDNANVGIGTNDPKGKLHVNGSFVEKNTYIGNNTTFTVDFSQGTIFTYYWTTNSDLTITPSNGPSGASQTVTVYIQSANAKTLSAGTGLSWGSYGTPTLTGNYQVDVFSITYVPAFGGISAKYYGFAAGYGYPSG